MSRFTNTTVLVRLILRRDRVRLPVWLVSLSALIGSSALAVQGLYDTPAAREGYERATGSSGAAIALSGPPVALDTLGGITVFEVSQVSVLGISLMAVFLTLRHTRADEEAGRTELLRAGVLGRNADLAAVGAVVSVASAVVGAAVTLSFLAAGLPTGGSLVFGAATATLGVFFTAVALACAQVTEQNRGAIGLALATLGVFYGLRAIGDVNDSVLTWLSPIGWTQAVHPFAGTRWWPLGLALLGAVAVAALAGWLTTRRDIGGGLVSARPGNRTASPLLTGPFALAARLQRGAVIGWMVGVGALGAVYGSFGQDVQDMIDDNPALADYFEQAAGGVSVTDTYFGVVLLFQALVAAGFTVSSVLRLRSEEAQGRAELVLATPVHRLRWTTAWLGVTALGSVAVLVAGGAGAGLVWGLMSSDLEQVGALVAAQLTYLPASVSLGALAFLLFGWAPRAAGAAWAFFGACFVVGWLGDLLSLPDWLTRLSPYERTPLVPGVELDLEPLAVIALIGLGMVAVGSLGFRRRDLVNG